MGGCVQLQQPAQENQAEWFQSMDGTQSFADFVNEAMQWEAKGSELLCMHAGVFSDKHIQSLFNLSSRILQFSVRHGPAGRTVSKSARSFSNALLREAETGHLTRSWIWPGMRTPVEAFNIFVARRWPWLSGEAADQEEEAEEGADRRDTLAVLRRDLSMGLISTMISRHGLPHLAPEATLEDGMCGPRWVVVSVLLRLMSETCTNCSPLRMAEIGVLHGGTSFPILSHHPNLHWVGVDPYDQKMSPLEREKQYPRDYISEKGNALFHETSKLLDAFAGRAQLIRATSSEAASQLVNKSFDLVFIDGNHAHHAVEEDLRVWEPKVRIGGILAGHDSNSLGVAYTLAKLRAGRYVHLACSNIWFWEVV